MNYRKSTWSFVVGLVGTGLMTVSAYAQNGVYTSVGDCGCQPAPAPVAMPMSDCGSCGNAGGGCGLGGGGGSLLGGGGRGGELGDPWTLFGRNRDEPRLNIGGWFQAGYHEESNDLFNSQPDSFNLHQGWLFVEKAATSENGELGLGFRFDGMYGIDANDTQAFGNPNPTFDLGPRFQRGGGYGWAIPQLYGEVAKGNWNVKVGHFYTLVGYEVVTAPDNFFYSHAMTMYNSEPFTHTGAIASYSVNDDTTLYGGWTAGWDSGFDFGAGSSFLGGFSTQLDPDVALTYITTFGNFGLRSNNNNDAYGHSIVLDMTMTDRLQWIVQSDLVRIASTGEDNIGLNQYLLYTVNERLALGQRMEWWKADDITGYQPHGGLAPTSSTSYYGYTVGANYRLTPNLIARPEYRVDWSPALDYSVGYFGVDFVATY